MYHNKKSQSLFIDVEFGLITYELQPFILSITPKHRRMYARLSPTNETNPVRLLMHTHNVLQNCVRKYE